MIPIRDENPTHQVPVVTYLLIILNVAAFLIQISLGQGGQDLINQFALNPARLTSDPSLSNFMDIFTSMFMHAGLAHILGNMLYLWIFGDNVEDRMGSLRYFIFYLSGGVLASLAHVFIYPSSTTPTVGASGAIAAVLGAYFVLYPGQKVVTLIPLGFYMRMTVLPAGLVLGAWFLLQFFQGVASLGGPDVGGVAFWAHIGGFVVGLALGKILDRGESAPQGYEW
jgi:membrane associated rhomboid family serine protease